MMTSSDCYQKAEMCTANGARCGDLYCARIGLRWPVTGVVLGVTKAPRRLPRASCAVRGRQAEDGELQSAAMSFIGPRSWPNAPKGDADETARVTRGPCWTPDAWRRLICYSAAMRSMMECLDKAAEMDARTAHCMAPEARALYLKLGLRWRELAVRALRQDTWADMNRWRGGGPTAF